MCRERWSSGEGRAGTGCQKEGEERSILDAVAFPPFSSWTSTSTTVKISMLSCCTYIMI